MVGLIFLAPLTYWYITIPEMFYILVAANSCGEAMMGLYMLGLVAYFFAFAINPMGTMTVAGLLIAIHFLVHLIFGQKDQYYEPSIPSGYTNQLDEEAGDGFHSYISGFEYRDYNKHEDSFCPYCGSDNTDDNHCYDCDKDHF